MSSSKIATQKPINPPRKWRILFGLSIAVLGLALLVLVAEAKSLVRQDFGFEHEGNELMGTLVLPEGEGAPKACMVFVHGSGDMPRDAYGYYEPLWHLFAERGWCSVSWDKPGVGESSGDWRNQSMADRASEVSSAIEVLRKEGGLGSGRVAMIGFSQAGWVMPKVVNQRDDIEFVVSVSGAVNWMAQSRYSGRMRRLAEGMDASDRLADEKASARIDELLRRGAPYSEYHELATRNDHSEPMTESFWGFALRNWKTDVREDLLRLNVPMLALFGSHDAYVDASSSAEIYRQLLARSNAPFFHVEIIEGADHGLMPTDKIEPAHEGIEAWLLLLRIWFAGDDLYAEGFISRLEQWLDRFESVAF